MKTYSIIAVTLTLLFFFIYKYSSSKVTKTDENYIVLDNFNDIEIREYKNQIYASFTPRSYDERNMSFRNIAPFIFGDNSQNEEIGMTTPVVIKMNNNEMAFIMPDRYNLENLPKPNNSKLVIYEEKRSIKAVIKYSGYSNKTKEMKMINKLKSELTKSNINYKNDFELLVYNSPYEVINRKNEITVSVDYNNKKKAKMKNKKIYFGSGCFWCTEAVFEDVIGVENVVSGYSGGNIDNPTYNQVVTGNTNHAEVCMIEYNEEIIKLDELLEIFFFSHDPTTINRQGNDVGSHYRSIILFNNNIEEEIINLKIEEYNNEYFNKKIVTEVKEFSKFYTGENYHQNYYLNNPKNPYCNNVITPKLIEARKKLSKYY